MKAKLDNFNEFVEILNYWPNAKGVCIGNFTVQFRSTGQKISKCKHFSKDGEEWFNFPSDEVKGEDGEKTKYWPYVSYPEGSYKTDLRKAILEALSQREATNGQSKSPKRNAHTVEDQSPPLWV